MSSFTRDVPLLTKKGHKKKQVLESFRYWLNDLHDEGPVIIVPQGFWTDGASIPRFAWSIVGTPFESDYLQGAVLHDWLYHQVGWFVFSISVINQIKYPKEKVIYDKSSNRVFVQFTRKACDLMFYDAMQYLETPFWKRKIILRALDIAGWKAWNDHRRRWLRKGRHPLYLLKEKVELL